MNPVWLKREPSGSFLVSLHVQPGAKRTEIVGLHGDALKIRLASPPVEGKANECLIGFLAELLDVPQSHVALVSGATSRQKRLRVTGVSVQALAAIAA